MDYYLDNTTLYWLDEQKKEINRVMIPHYSVESYVFESHIDRLDYHKEWKPTRALTIDWLHDLIYWLQGDTDSGYSLVVSTVDGRYPRVVIDKLLQDPRDLVVDPIRATVYISNYNPQLMKAEILKYVGPEMALETLVSDAIGDPRGLAVDYFKEGRVYWCDFSQQSIHSILPDGTSRVTIAYFGKFLQQHHFYRYSFVT